MLEEAFVADMLLKAIKKGNSRANALVMLKKADLFVIDRLGGD